MYLKKVSFVWERSSSVFENCLKKGVETYFFSEWIEILAIKIPLLFLILTVTYILITPEWTLFYKTTLSSPFNHCFFPLFCQSLQLLKRFRERLHSDGRAATVCYKTLNRYASVTSSEAATVNHSLFVRFWQFKGYRVTYVLGDK